MNATVITLIRDTFTQDSIGQIIPSGTERTEIFVNRESVSRAEWFAAQSAGLNSEFVFSTPSVNYTGQQFAEYEGKKYIIYRTFTQNGTTELYLGQRGGLYGISNGE